MNYNQGPVSYVTPEGELHLIFRTTDVIVIFNIVGACEADNDVDFLGVKIN